MAGFFASWELWLANPLTRGAVGLVLGAIAGSFIATILIRWPQGRGAMTGRSRCDSCDAALGPGDLVPILSWLAARGRCRRCGARIDRKHLAVEIAAGLVGGVSLLAHPLPLALATALLGWWLLLIAVLDLEHQWLPDRLTLPLIGLGLAAAWAGLGPPWPERLAGAAIGWALLFAIARGYRATRGREGMGGGDPKLFAAIGAWVGAMHLPFVLLGAGIAGLTSAFLLKRRGAAVTATTRLPLGTYLALAAWPIWMMAAGAGAFGPAGGG